MLQTYKSIKGFKENMLVVLKDGNKVFQGYLYSVAEYLGISATRLAWQILYGNELELEVITKQAYMKRKGEK